MHLISTLKTEFRVINGVLQMYEYRGNKILCYNSKEKFLIIRHLNDLDTRVFINSYAAALSYARLHTNYFTGQALREFDGAACFEIIRKSEIDLAFTNGDTNAINHLRRAPLMGIITDEVANKYGFTKINYSKDSKYYYIDRCIVVLKKKNKYSNLLSFRITERISKSGDFSIMIRKMIKNSDKIRWESIKVY